MRHDLCGSGGLYHSQDDYDSHVFSDDFRFVIIANQVLTRQMVAVARDFVDITVMTMATSCMIF